MFGLIDLDIKNLFFLSLWHSVCSFEVGLISSETFLKVSCFKGLLAKCPCLLYLVLYDLTGLVMLPGGLTSGLSVI